MICFSEGETVMTRMFIKFDLKSETIPYTTNNLSSDVNFRYKLQTVLGQRLEVAAWPNMRQVSMETNSQTGFQVGVLTSNGGHVTVESADDQFELSGLNSSVLTAGMTDNQGNNNYVTFDAVAIDAF